jgi:putative membrane protein
MRLGVILAALAGIAVAAYLIFYVGLHAVFAAIASVGWLGFAALCIYGLTLFLILGAAWFVLVPDAPSSRALTFVWGRLIRDSAGEVLPFSQFGGILIGARAVILRGISAPVAFASTVVDVTTEMMAQIVFILIGLCLFVAKLKGGAGELPLTIVAGIVFAVAGAVAFIFLQRRGLGFAQKLAARFLPGAVKHAQDFRRVIEAIYDSPARLAGSSAIHLLGWIASGLGTWIAIRLTGAHIDIASAIAIESVLCALRSAAIFVPGALGVQEAGYAMLMPLFGLRPEIGLAISLLKRAREIAIGVPALLAWQALEGKRALAQPAEL